MVRLYYTVAVGFFVALYYLCALIYYDNHKEKYSMEQRYKLVKSVAKKIDFYARIVAEVHGKDNLPKDGGYIVYPNHQDRYDATAMINAIDVPCAVIMDAKRANSLIVGQAFRLLGGQMLDHDDMRQQAAAGKRIVEDIKDGMRYVLFPEGRYADNKNTLLDFHAGSFKFAKRARCPIIPVALIDTYKVFGENSIQKVRIQVNILEIINYCEFKDLSTTEIAKMVKARIQQAIDQSVEMCDLDL